MDIQCSNEVQQQGMVVNIVPAQILRFDMVCRVCGNENEKNLHIFGADGQNYELALKMNTYLPIKVADNDSLPSNCCWNCATLIFSWHELVVTSIETDRKLKELQIVIAKPLMVSAENAQTEPEEVLPHIENSSSTSNTEALEEDKALRSTDSQDIQKQTCRTNSFPKDDVLLNQKRRLCIDAAKENTSSLKNLPSSSNTQNFNFICNVCDKYFTTKRSLVRHQKNLHKKYEKQIYRCKSCPAQFTDENEYYSHTEKIHFEVRDPMNTQTERSSKFFCNICNNGYIRKNELKKHIRIKHLVSSTKLQKKRTNLAKYKVTLNNEVFYQCDVCENRYRQAYNLSRHKLIHVNGVHSYMCDICGKQYNTKSSLRRHCTETHTTNRYSCKICNAQFRAKVSLVQHLNIHNDNRPFVCDICGKAFRQDSSLRIHKMYHTTNFRFTCKVCGKEYRRNNELKVHMTLHTGVKAYNCTLCEKTFRLSSTLRKHVKLHDRLETCWCEICGSPFSQLRYLKNHQRCHQNTINMDNEEQETIVDDVGLKDSSGQ